MLIIQTSFNMQLAFRTLGHVSFQGLTHHRFCDQEQHDFSRYIF